MVLTLRNSTLTVYYGIMKKVITLSGPAIIQQNINLFGGLLYEENVNVNFRQFIMYNIVLTDKEIFRLLGM